ncbi:MAG TPA: hypothetical protein VNZ64_01510 [Candidatus Acidoferrum sp.]|jgi:hypothetical protein|nr:hypothetical protein [Candidatus Acidoferrum sp.]
MFSDAQKSGSVGASEQAPVNTLQMAGSEVLRQRVAKIQDAQKRLLSALQSNQLPLSQVAAEMARLEADLAEAQLGLNQTTGAPG